MNELSGQPQGRADKQPLVNIKKKLDSAPFDESIKSSVTQSIKTTPLSPTPISPQSLSRSPFSPHSLQLHAIGPTYIRGRRTTIDPTMDVIQEKTRIKPLPKQHSKQHQFNEQNYSGIALAEQVNSQLKNTPIPSPQNIKESSMFGDRMPFGDSFQYEDSFENMDSNQVSFNKSVSQKPTQNAFDQLNGLKMTSTKLGNHSNTYIKQSVKETFASNSKAEMQTGFNSQNQSSFLYPNQQQSFTTNSHNAGKTRSYNSTKKKPIQGLKFFEQKYQDIIDYERNLSKEMFTSPQNRNNMSTQKREIRGDETFSESSPKKFKSDETTGKWRGTGVTRRGSHFVSSNKPHLRTLHQNSRFLIFNHYSNQSQSEEDQEDTNLNTSDQQLYQNRIQFSKNDSTIQPLNEQDLTLQEQQSFMLPIISPKNNDLNQTNVNLPSKRYIERYREKSKASGSKQLIAYDGAFKRKISAHDERIGIVQSHITLTRALKRQGSPDFASMLQQTMKIGAMELPSQLHKKEMQRQPISLVDDSLAGLMKSSAILTQTGASTSQIKTAIKQVHSKKQSKGEPLLADQSIAQLRGDSNDVYILPEVQLHDNQQNRSNGDLIKICGLPDVDVEIFGQQEKQTVIAALQKRLGIQRHKSNTSDVQGHIGGRTNTEPSNQEIPGIDWAQFQENKDEKKEDIIETNEYQRVARAARNLTALKEIINEDATQKGRGVNSPKVCTDQKDQKLIDMYQNHRAMRPEVYEKIVSRISTPQSKLNSEVDGQSPLQSPAVSQIDSKAKEFRLYSKQDISFKKVKIMNEREARKRDELKAKPYLSSENLTRENLQRIRLQKFSPQWLKKEFYDNISTDQGILSLMQIDAGLGKDDMALGRQWGAVREAVQGREITAYIQFLAGGSAVKAEALAQEEPKTKDTLASAINPTDIQTARAPKGDQERHFKGQGIAIEKPTNQQKPSEQVKKKSLFKKLDISNKLLGNKKQKVSETNYAAQFDENVNRGHDMLELVTRQFEDRLSFFRLCKNGASAGTLQRYKNDPRLAYFLQCQEDQDLVLPLLEYVDKKTLCLQSYTLSIGHCNAIAAACPLFGYMNINRIIFENCGIDDEEFSSILKGLQTLRDLKKIIYRQNLFGPLALKQLRPIIQHPIPDHLEELRIENCKIAPEIARALLDIINEKNFLTKLSLINIGLNDESFGKLCEFIEASSGLEEISIAWAVVSPISMHKFLQIISKSKKLQYVDLSWTQLQDSAHKEKLEWETKDFNHQLSQLAQENSKSLCDLIKRNRSLIHLDLSHTGMSEAQIWQFGAALRRSKSLRSLHLSGNPGITERVIKFLAERAHALYYPKMNNIDFNLMPSNLNTQIREKKFDKVQQFSKTHVSDQKTKENVGNTPNALSLTQLQRAINAKTQTEVKNINNRLGEHAQLSYIDRGKHRDQTRHTMNEPNSKTLVVSRKLDHKLDMPGSGQWRIYSDWKLHAHKVGKGLSQCQVYPKDEECFVCDKQVYTLIFWNHLIGAVELQKFQPDDTAFFLNKLSQINVEIHDESTGTDGSNTASPIIFGQFTNWQPQQMVDIRDFCERIDLDKPDLFQRCKTSGLIPEYVESIEKLKPDERMVYEAEVEAFRDHYKEIWKGTIQKYMKYKFANIVNAEKKAQIENVNVPLYVFATFMRSGKQYYMIKDQEANSKSFKWYPASCIARFREEEIPRYKKRYARVKVERRFVKEASVFATWKQDDPTVFKKCIEHDKRYWKLASKVVKDRQELKTVEASINRHYSFLKALHIHMASSSGFPATTEPEWRKFQNRCRFLDQNLKQNTIDNHFYAVNFEGEAQDDNPDKALIRFEFIELLVRVAKEKYFRTGSCPTVAQAFEKLLETNIVPVCLEEAAYWQGFREELIYTVEVNDVLHQNREGLRKVYDYYVSQVSVQKLLTLNNIKDLFIDRCDVKLQEKDIIYYFAMSKMTIADENGEGSVKYSQLHYVEFLEMICRIAHFKFKGSEMEYLPLQEKIEHILDGIFVIIKGLKRKSVNLDDEFEETESDQDY